MKLVPVLFMIVLDSDSLYFLLPDCARPGNESVNVP